MIDYFPKGQMQSNNYKCMHNGWPFNSQNKHAYCQLHVPGQKNNLQEFIQIHFFVCHKLFIKLSRRFFFVPVLMMMLLIHSSFIFFLLYWLRQGTFWWIVPIHYISFQLRDKELNWTLILQELRQPHRQVCHREQVNPW